MNSQPRSKPLPPSVRMALVRAAEGDCLPETFTMTTTYPMPWAEKLLFQTAAFFVGLAMRLRQRRVMFQGLQRQIGIFASRGEYEKFLDSLPHGIQNLRKK